MGMIHTETAANNSRIWLTVNQRVRISSQTVRRVCREGLKLVDLDLVLQYGEQLAEGYHMSDNAINQALQSSSCGGSTRLREQLDRLRNVVVVEVMDTILTTYRLSAEETAGEEPLQGEFVLH
jgi:hypothetical protein